MSEPESEPASMIKPVLYVFVNKGLGMSAGKIAAQVAQATVGAYRLSPQANQEDWWAEHNGQHHTTYVMGARDETHLYNIQQYLSMRGFNSYMMIDEGLTEVDPHTATVLAVEIVDKADGSVGNTFGLFELYRDILRVSLEFER